jgi:hypothetical protein
MTRRDPLVLVVGMLVGLQPALASPTRSPAG